MPNERYGNPRHGRRAPGASNRIFQAVLDSLDEQFALIDHTGTIVYVNPSWQRFGEVNGLDKHFRWPGSSYLEACRKAAVHGDSDATAVAEGLSAVLNGRQNTFHYEYPCHSAEEKRWFILRAVPVRGYEGRYFAVSHQNITRRKLAEESAAHSALHDSMTGLANRRHFDDFLLQAWRRGHRSGKPLCLLMIDLDHFKAYNDAHGHLEGDRCLCLVGNLLRIHASRETDLAARFGGDEFALVLGDTDEAGGRVVAGKILQGMGEGDPRHVGWRQHRAGLPHSRRQHGLCRHTGPHRPGRRCTLSCQGQRQVPVRGGRDTP